MQLPSTASSSATPRDATPNPGSVSFNPTNTKNPTKPSPDGNLLHTLKRHWKQTAQVMRRPKEKPMTYQQQQEHYKNYFEEYRVVRPWVRQDPIPTNRK
jgi:hypothetical protein